MTNTARDNWVSWTAVTLIAVLAAVSGFTQAAGAKGLTMCASGGILAVGFALVAYLTRSGFGANRETG